jgi:hypothetical protein
MADTNAFIVRRSNRDTHKYNILFWSCLCCIILTCTVKYFLIGISRMRSAINEHLGKLDMENRKDGFQKVSLLHLSKL